MNVVTLVRSVDNVLFSFITKMNNRMDYIQFVLFKLQTKECLSVLSVNLGNDGLTLLG